MTTDHHQSDRDARASRNRHRLLIVVRSFVIAGVAGLVVIRLVPARMADIAAICVTWIAFYPVARLKVREPWWAHWARGVIVLIGFWLALRLFR